MASLVFVVDTSPGMAAVIAGSNGGNSKETTKLQLALDVVREVSLFLTYHAEWEYVSLLFVSDTYRQVIPLRSARAFHQQLNSEVIGDWQKENIPYATLPTAYLSLLTGSHAGVLEAGRHSCVIVLSDGSPRTAGLETAGLSPPRYIRENLLPVPFESFVFFIDLLASLSGREASGLPNVPEVLRISDDRTETISFGVTGDDRDASRLSSLLCQKLFEPWIGQLVFNGMNEETCCLFPNPWGFRGRFRCQEAPSKLEVENIIYRHATVQNSGVSRVLPLDIAPKLWRSPAEFERLGYVSHPESWKPNACYGEASKDFLGKLLDSKDFREQRAVLSLNGPKGFSGVLRVGFEDPVKKIHSLDMVMSVHKKFAILLEYMPEQDDALLVKENSGLRTTEGRTSEEEGEVRSEDQVSVTIKQGPDGCLEGRPKVKRSPAKERRPRSPVWSEIPDKEYRTDKKHRFGRSSSPAERCAKNAVPRRFARAVHRSYAHLKARLDFTYPFQDFFVGGFPKGINPDDVERQLRARGIKEIQYVNVRKFPTKGYDTARVSIGSKEVDRFLGAGFLEPHIFIGAWNWKHQRDKYRALRGACPSWTHFSLAMKRCRKITVTMSTRALS